jgi:hypothetical protein
MNENNIKEICPGQKHGQKDQSHAVEWHATVWQALLNLAQKLQ